MLAHILRDPLRFRTARARFDQRTDLETKRKLVLRGYYRITRTRIHALHPLVNLRGCSPTSSAIRSDFEPLARALTRELTLKLKGSLYSVGITGLLVPASMRCT